MSTVVRLEEIAGRLQEYQQQMTALNEALEALKKVGELISEAMAEDRNALIGLALQMRDEAVGEADVYDGVTIEAVDASPSTETSLDANDAAEFSAATSSQEILVLEPVTADALAAIAAAAAAGRGASVDAQVDAKGDTEKAAVMTDFVQDAVVPLTAEPAKVVDLASRRRRPSLPLPSRRRTLGFAAGLLVLAVGGTIGHEVLQGEFLQRLMDLGTCDGDALSANPDCALLAWMLL